MSLQRPRSDETCAKDDYFEKASEKATDSSEWRDALAYQEAEPAASSQQQFPERRRVTSSIKQTTDHKHDYPPLKDASPSWYFSGAGARGSSLDTAEMMGHYVFMDGDSGKKKDDDISPKGSRRFKGASIFKFLTRTMMCSIPLIIFIIAFSAIGVGHASMVLSRKFKRYSKQVGLSLCLYALLLHVLDHSYWPNKRIRYIAYTLFITGVVVFVYLLQSTFPIGPLCCLIVITPLYLVGPMKHILHDSWPVRNYLLSMGRPLNISSVLTMVIWLLWTISGYGWGFEEQDNNWDSITQIRYAQDLGCSANFQEFPQCRNETLFNETGTNGVCFKVKEFSYQGTKSVYSGGLGMRIRHVLWFDPDCKSYCVMVYNECLHAFLVWVNPLMAAVAMLMISFVCIFLGHATMPTTKTTECLGKPPTPGLSVVEKDMSIGFRLAAKLYVLLIFAMWCSSSIAGAGAGLTTAFLSYIISSVVSMCILFYLVTSSELDDYSTAIAPVSSSKPVWTPLPLGSLVDTSDVLQKYQPYVDAARGFLVLTTSPFIAIYIAVSFLNECVRKSELFPYSLKPTKETDDAGTPRWKQWLTMRVREQLNRFYSWEDRSRVYRYTVYWGIVYMAVCVFGPQVNEVLLSRFIRVLSTMPLVAVTVILFVVGLVVFLFPPTPGGPVYIAGGTVIAASGRESLGILGAISYNVVLQLALKLVSSAIQQKVIGEKLSNYVSTRRLVGVNSQIVRAVKLILIDPSMSLAKVAILVGGPDWPTSVLCGILHLDLIPILIATTPSVLVIIPMTLTGVYAYMASLPPGIDGNMKYPAASTMSAICAVISALVQFGFMAVAGYYVERVIKTRKADIDNMPMDAEIQVLDKQEQAFVYAYEEATRWRATPRGIRITLKLSVWTMIASCFVVHFFQHECFPCFDLIYASDENVKLSSRFITPLGCFVLSLFILSCSLLSFYLTWADRSAHELMTSPLQTYLNKSCTMGTPCQYDSLENKNMLNIVSVPSEGVPICFSTKFGPASMRYKQPEYGTLTE